MKKALLNAMLFYATLVAATPFNLTGTNLEPSYFCPEYIKQAVGSDILSTNN